MEKNNKYSISELSERVNVTKRTIHYYVQRGLIPPPEGRGVHSKYSDEHYYLILLIKKLQKKYYPLDKIKEIVQFKNLEEVKKELEFFNILNNEKKINNNFQDFGIKYCLDIPKFDINQSSVKSRIYDNYLSKYTQSKIEKPQPSSEEFIRVRFENDIELLYPKELDNSNLIRKIVKTILEIFEKT